ncbi:MAG TPA: CDP-archaeol synthase [Ktedonobacterales bacterium]|jgi:phosphatidate cytidylyltransferase
MKQSAPPPSVANPDPGAANDQWRHSLLLRVSTGIPGIAIILGLLWGGGWILFGGLVLIVGAASYEMHRMLTGEGMRPLSLLSLALSLDFLVAAILPAWRTPLIEGGISLLLLLSFTWLLTMRKTLNGSLVDWALTMAVPFYIGWPLSFFLRLRGNQIGPSTGFWWVLVVLVGVWAFDSAAFFTGRFLGRHKLATVISPSKTWEGVIGGIAGGIAVTLLATRPLNVPVYHAIILGLLISVAGQVGDLAESLIKRQTHVKDSSHLIPGHGGMLDRIDSQLFAVVVVYLYASWALPQMLS